ncbi:hypothetical protein, partial [uncultured Mameliella sp.]|uniref:hypothetical protein n=1 Tax=uncultured Mameliella sp. TaxID=1447087 RepID=UPI0026122C60
FRHIDGMIGQGGAANIAHTQLDNTVAQCPQRPGHLPRRESVTAVFDSPDSAPLVSDGDGLHRVWHPRMGAADLYMTAVPRRAGGADIEIVLN